MAVKNIQRAGIWGDIAGAAGLLLVVAPLFYVLSKNGGGFDGFGAAMIAWYLMPFVVVELLMFIPTWLAVRRGSLVWAIIFPLIIPMGMYGFYLYSAYSQYVQFGEFVPAWL